MSPSHDALGRCAARLGMERFELLEMPAPPLMLPDRLDLQAQLCALIRDERPELVIWEALRCYLVAAPPIVPAAAFALLESERFLRFPSIANSRDRSMVRRTRRAPHRN